MPFRHPAAVRAEAVALVRRGALPAVAAARVGADPSTVYAWLHEDAPKLVGRRDHRCWRCRPALARDDAAYAQLLGLYLGDGWVTSGAGRGCSLSIACADAWPEVADECEGVMRTVLAPAVTRVRRRGCHELRSASEHWPCLLPQHGPGKKHERPIVLEPWQRAIVQEHPGRLLRGLFHSDGWRGHNVAVHRRPDGFVTRYRYPRYEFTNLSADIRGLCTDALDRLGIAWRPNGEVRISVNRREAVAALDDHVGPKS